MAHKAKLTPRRLKVVECILNGLKEGEIEDALCMSPSTLKEHFVGIFNLLGLDPSRHQRVQLVYFWNCELFQIGLKELGLI